MSMYQVHHYLNGRLYQVRHCLNVWLYQVHYCFNVRLHQVHHCLNVYVPGTSLFKWQIVAGTSLFKWQIVPGTSLFRCLIVPGTSLLKCLIVPGALLFKCLIVPGTSLLWLYQVHHVSVLCAPGTSRQPAHPRTLSYCWTQVAAWLESDSPSPRAPCPPSWKRWVMRITSTSSRCSFRSSVAQDAKLLSFIFRGFVLEMCMRVNF